MRLVEAQGATDVARLLRSLADEVELGAGDINGHRVKWTKSLRGVVDAPDSSETVTMVEVQLLHPAQRAWDPTALRIAMTRPGD